MAVKGEKEQRRATGEVIRGTLSFVFVIVVILALVLIGRILYIINVRGDEYTKAVLSQESYRSRVLPAQRGVITDRNGIVLARSEKTYNVIIDPAVILSADYYYEPSLKALVESLGYDEATMKNVIAQNSASSYIVFERNIDYSRVSDYNKYKSSHKHVVGVWFEEEYKRVYPYSTFASHVIGFATRDGGSNGLEQYYNEVLTGSSGMQYGYFDNELNQVQTIKAAENGNTLVSTIDYNIQSIIEKKIREFRADPGCNNIGIIIMDPNNGEILGMASNEEYDLNNPRSLDTWYTPEEQEAMTQDERLNIIYKNWRNFCVSDTYEPGSTFKSLTVASALEENVVTSSDTFNCAGYNEVGGWRIGCNKKEGHGTLTLTESLMKSCNCALMSIADRLGRDDFYKYQNSFGFGKLTGIDITGEATGIIIDKSKLNVTELATSSFGTTFNVTMVQMAAAYCSLINGGTYYTPHLVKQITTDDGTEVKSFDNLEVRQTVSGTTSEFIRQALYKTVESGTATPAKVNGYLIAGKTGTAQKRPRTDKKYVVSFAGFAPADDPKVMMYVVIDEIHDEELKGSSRPATSMTSAVFQEILPYLGLYPEGDIEYVVDLELLHELENEMDPADEDNPDVIPDDFEEAE